MKLVTIALPEHQVLRQPAKTVSFPLDEETKKFITDLSAFFAEMKSPFGKPAGLAAPQVGVGLRIIIIQIPPEAKLLRKDVYDTVPPTVLINPTYIPIGANGKNKDWEACYSVEDKMGEVCRFNTIQYEAFNEYGEKITATVSGFLARLIQHEVGHLNGELYIDLLDPECRYGVFDEMLKIRMKERAGTNN